MFDFSDSLPHFCLALTFVFDPHLSFRRLLFRSIHPPKLRSFWTPAFVFHQSSRSSNHRLPSIFVFHQPSLSTNLRLRIFHTLFPHNLVYPELFFVPMSISTAVQIPIQSAISQLVTRIIRQTERCSSPCFIMGVSIIGCRPKLT